MLVSNSDVFFFFGIFMIIRVSVHLTSSWDDHAFNFVLPLLAQNNEVATCASVSKAEHL